MRLMVQIPRKVFIRKYLAALLGISGKTIERKFWPDYSPLAVGKYLISKGFQSGRSKPGANHSAPSTPLVPVAYILTGRDLRKRRLAIGISRVELAKKLEVSPRTIEGWEQERFRIYRPVQLRIMSFLSQEERRRGIMA